MFSFLQKSKDNVSKLPFKTLLKTKKSKTIVFSVIAGVVIIISSIQLGNFIGNPQIQTIGILGGIMISVVPIALLHAGTNRRGESIDKNLPLFLLSLVSAVNSGSSLLRAIEESAGRQMGSLTPMLKNLRANISWGMPHDEALDTFTNKVQTKLARRVATLLQIAMDIGGDVASTLDLVQKHVSDMQRIEQERKAALAPYLYTIYISFVVFIAVAVLLTSQFFTEIENVQTSLRQTAEDTNISLGMFGALLGVDVSELTSIMFHMGLVEAVFGGLAAGKISQGSFIAGIKHIVIMIIIAVLAFSLMGQLG